MSMNKGQALGLIEREVERFVAATFSRTIDQVIPVSLSGLTDINDLENRVIRSMLIPWFERHLTDHGISVGSVRGCYICQTIFTEVDRRHNGDIRAFTRGKMHHFLAELELMG